MKAVVFRAYGGAEVLSVSDLEIPTIKGNEILVKVYAASVNPIDWQIREGLLKAYMHPKMPAILGCDLAGEVVEVGVRTTRLKKGDLVFGMMPQDWGAQAEYVAIAEDLLAKKPEHMTMAEAAGAGVIGITALQALRDIAGLRSGQELLINGASSGVGMAAVQIALHLGARIAAVCSAENFDLVKGLGAHTLIDYKTTDFSTLGRKYDVIFDCIGNRPYNTCRDAFRERWTHITTMPDMKTILRAPINLFSRGKARMIIATPSSERISVIASLLESKELKVVVDKVFQVDRVLDAQTYSKSKRAKGKIIVQFVP